MSEENPARLSFDYVWAQVNAAIGILTRNPNAVAAFDFSFAGFFRSFLAAIIVLPIYVYELIAGREFIDELRAADPALAGNLPGISFPTCWSKASTTPRNGWYFRSCSSFWRGCCG